MDYTPISTSRVLAAFALTAFVALVPILFFVLQSGAGIHDQIVVGVGSAALTAVLIGALMLTVALGRRMVRRPSRA
jgi:hypothetical protein